MASSRACASIPQRYSRCRLRYWRPSGPHLTGFSDADCATCKEDRKSMAGHCFNFGSASISWSSKKQTCLATSSIETELLALSEATNEARHLRTILETLGRPAPANLMWESQLSLALVQKDEGSPKAKHFATGLAFVGKIVQDERRGINLVFVATANNQADQQRDSARPRRHSIFNSYQPSEGVRT